MKTVSIEQLIMNGFSVKIKTENEALEFGLILEQLHEEYDVLLDGVLEEMNIVDSKYPVSLNTFPRGAYVGVEVGRSFTSNVEVSEVLTLEQLSTILEEGEFQSAEDDENITPPNDKLLQAAQRLKTMEESHIIKLSGEGKVQLKDNTTFELSEGDTAEVNIHNKTVSLNLSVMVGKIKAKQSLDVGFEDMLWVKDNEKELTWENTHITITETKRITY